MQGLQKLRAELDELKARQAVLAHRDEYLETTLTQWRERLSPFSESLVQSLQINSAEQLRSLLRSNLFILISCACGRWDMLNPWCLDRCNEVQSAPDGYLDLWSRGFYKSTIITFGLTIYDILRTHGRGGTGEEFTFGIFSYTRPIAKAFLRQIKIELEKNTFLQQLFSDILYDNPHRDSEKWSEDDGIIVKRTSNPKESTLEAWGLVDSQPTSKHFKRLILDDIVTHDGCLTAYSIEKINRAWENALNLVSKEGKFRGAGTRKHYGDTYSLIMERGTLIPRKYTPFNDDGTMRFKTQEEIDDLRRNMGEFTFASEILQEPQKGSGFAFDPSRVLTHAVSSTDKLLLFFVCDPANSVKKTSDYTSMMVWGLDDESNLLLIDGIRDRIEINDRWEELYKLHRKYPKITKIYYEHTGMQTDFAYFKLCMDKIGYYFDNKFVNLKPETSKEAFIRRLDALFFQQKIRVPEFLTKTRANGDNYDLVHEFLYDEMEKYPQCKHDDMLNNLAYAYDLVLKKAVQPPSKEAATDWEGYYQRMRQRNYDSFNDGQFGKSF